jgi:CRP-like cAMP-binding protein
MGTDSQPLFQQQLIAKAEELGAKSLRENPGKVLFEQGSTGGSFFIIKEGEVELQFDGTSRRLLNAGDFFGEIGTFSQLNRTATAICRRRCLLLELEREQAEQLISENPELKEEIFSNYYFRLLHFGVRKEPSMFAVNDDSLRDALGLFKLRTIEKDTPLFEESQESTGIYFVVRGNIEIQKKKGAVAQNGPGKFVGEIGALHKVKRTATAVATEKTEVLHCPAGKVRTLLRTLPSLETYLRRVAASRIISAFKK